MPNIIEALVVTLGLDPAKFGSGVSAASKNLTNFENLVKRLGINEAKLDDKQKAALKSMRDLAMQSNRTGKELHAASGINADFWKMAEKGALSFGGALAAIAVADFTRDTTAGVAAQGRLAASLGMTTQELGSLGDAIEAGVGGSADSAKAALVAMNKELEGAQFGQNPDNMLAISAQLSRYSGGAPTPIFDADLKPRPLIDILEGWSDAVKNLGTQKAQGALGGKLPPDLINFLALGRSGMETAINKAAENQPDDADAKKYQDVETAATEAEQSLRKMAIAAIAAFSPELILGLKNLTAYLSWAARGFKDSAKRDNEIRDNDAAYWGPGWLAQKDAERIIDGSGIAVDSEKHSWNQFAKTGETFTPWNREQRIARAKQLLEQKEDATKIAGMIMQEEAAGWSPGAQTPVVPIGGAPPNLPSTPTAPPNVGAPSRGIRDNNPTDLMYANQEGATPDPYTDPWGHHRVMAKFADLAAGITAASRQVELDYGRGVHTIRDLAHAWAPKSDHNDEEAWAGKVAGAAGMDVNKAYGATDFLRIARSIPYGEGTVAGNTTTTHITVGDVHVHTPATDTKGIARDLHGAIVAQSTSGAN